MHISNSSNSTSESAIGCTDIGKSNRKCLQIPVRRLKRWFENFLWEKVETWTVESCREDDHVTLDFDFTARPSFDCVQSTFVEDNPVFSKMSNVALEPLSLPAADLVENCVVANWRLGKESHIRWSKVL